jgi:hypothetical protein
VIDTGNPQVFFAIPGPVPVDNLYPPNRYWYSHGLVRVDSRVYPYLYLWWVTCGYATNESNFNNNLIITLVIKYKINLRGRGC